MFSLILKSKDPADGIYIQISDSSKNLVSDIFIDILSALFASSLELLNEVEELIEAIESTPFGELNHSWRGFQISSFESKP